MNIYRVHCTVPPPFSKLQWQRWPPLVPRRSFYPPFSALSHPLSSALFAPLLLALRMVLFLLHLLIRFASSPPGFARSPLSSHLFARPFRSSFFLPSSSPFPLCFRPLLFCFRPSLSAFALFVCIGAITVAHLGDISKKRAACNGWANDVWCGRDSHWRTLRSDQALCETCLPGVKCACWKRRERVAFLLHSALYLEKAGNSWTERRPNGRNERWREDARASES